MENLTNVAKKVLEKLKGVPKKQLTIGVVTIIVIIAAISVINANTLSGEDKIAYNLTLEAAQNFKDPSSVRLVSAEVDGGNLYCKLSATNSYGARGTEYYKITSTGSITKITSSALMAMLDRGSSINIEKVNKALEKALKL